MKRLRYLLILAIALVGLCGICLSVEAQSGNAARNPNSPVTFTQEGWAYQGRDLIFSSWRYAFYNFSFYGKVRRNWLYAGGTRSMSIEGSRTGLNTLTNWFPQTGPSGPLCTTQDYITPATIPHAGALAGEVVALTMNIAFNDMRLMPRHAGYDLEKFTIASGPYKRRTVTYIWNIGNRLLGGDPPARYGLRDYDTITAVLHAINANYEFINYDTYIDRGFLIPNRKLGRPAAAHYPRLIM